MRVIAIIEPGSAVAPTSGGRDIAAAVTAHFAQAGRVGEIHQRVGRPGLILTLEVDDLSQAEGAAASLGCDVALVAFGTRLSPELGTSGEADPHAEPIIVKAEDAKAHPFHGKGGIRRYIYPNTVGSRSLFVGSNDVKPGDSAHHFHRHGVEDLGDATLSYAPDFEEFYFITAGRGSMRWILADGTVVERDVVAGDAVYMPPAVAAHDVFNASETEVLSLIYGGTPPAVLEPKTQDTSPPAADHRQIHALDRVDPGVAER